MSLPREALKEGDPSLCARSAGADRGSPSICEGRYEPDGPERPIDEFEVAVWDPYLTAPLPAGNVTGPAGAGSDPSPEQPSSSNLGWARFSEPGAFACSLVAGAARGVYPKGMQSFFSSVKHNASSDALTRRHGLFTLPVDLMALSKQGLDMSLQGRSVSAWTQLICLALNKLAGWKGPVPTRRKGQQTIRALEGFHQRMARFLKLFPGDVEDPQKIWEELKKKKISYDGEEFTEPVALTVKQIFKPPP